MYEPSAAAIASRRANVAAPGDAAGLHDTVPLSSPATGRYVRMLGKERRTFVVVLAPVLGPQQAERRVRRNAELSVRPELASRSDLAL